MCFGSLPFSVKVGWPFGFLLALEIDGARLSSAHCVIRNAGNTGKERICWRKIQPRFVTADHLWCWFLRHTSTLRTQWSSIGTIIPPLTV